MKIVFDRVCSYGGLEDFSLELEVNRVCVINDSFKAIGKQVLRVLIGLDEIYSGSISLDGVEREDFIADHPLPRIFGHVFDHGGMLSNLSLRENLLLPYRMLNDETADGNFEAEMQSWMELFGLGTDLAARPNTIRPPEIKLLGFIRPLLFNPILLVIDDPYYLLNHQQRQTLLSVINKLRSDHLLLILSTDLDFTHDFADQIITL